MYALSCGNYRAAVDPILFFTKFLGRNPTAFTFDNASLNAEDLLAPQ